MKRTIVLTTAALLASASLAVPAYALDVGVGGQAGVGAQVGGGGSDSSGIGGNVGVGANVGAQAQTDSGSFDDDSIDSGTTASTNSDANFGSVISAIRSGKSNAAAIEGMSEVSSVTVVNVDDLAQGNNTQALENAVSDNEGEIADLQAAIEANADVMAELEGQSLDHSDVVAANVGADGALTVYVR